MEKTKVKHDEELAHAAESLEQIANGLEEWIEQQKGRFEHTTAAFRKKWISDWFSDFYIMKFFKDMVHKRRFEDIADTLRLYMPNIAESLKEVWNNFLRSVKFMQEVERNKVRIEKSHDLGFWCVNFFSTTAIPTVERLRHLVELTREYLAAPKQAETAEKRHNGELNKQVGRLLKSSSSDISASEIARILNENHVGEYKPTNPCAVGKTENWKKHREEQKNCKKK